MNKHAKFKLKLKRISNLKVAKLANINRKIVTRYWNEYLRYKKDLEEIKTIEFKVKNIKYI